MLLSFLFYIPVSLFKFVLNKFKKKKEDTYYFVGTWVAHQINDEEYQSAFYSLWIRKEDKMIPTEKEVKTHLTLFGLRIINFKIISISEWVKKDYDDYHNGEIVVEETHKPEEVKKEEVDYQSLIDKAVEEEDYETAAYWKKILEEKNKK
jgi:hypothetical protein